jgi:hypothetical protein
LAQWSYVQYHFESGAPAVFLSKQICGFKCTDIKSFIVFILSTSDYL